MTNHQAKASTPRWVADPDLSQNFADIDERLNNLHAQSLTFYDTKGDGQRWEYDPDEDWLLVEGIEEPVQYLHDVAANTGRFAGGAADFGILRAHGELAMSGGRFADTQHAFPNRLAVGRENVRSYAVIDIGRSDTGGALSGPDFSRVGRVHGALMDTEIDADNARTHTGHLFWAKINEASGATYPLSVVTVAGKAAANSGIQADARGLTVEMAYGGEAGTVTTLTALVAGPTRSLSGTAGAGTLRNLISFTVEDPELEDGTAEVPDDAVSCRIFAPQSVGLNNNVTLLLKEPTGTGAVVISVEGGANLDTAGTWNNASDERIKTGVETLSVDRSVTVLQGLRPVEYTHIKSGKPSVGFIAQEVRELLPELVHGDEASGILSLNYAGLTAPLVAGWQTHEARLNLLEARLGALEAV